MMQFYINGQPWDGTFPELEIRTLSAEEAFKNYRSECERFIDTPVFRNSFYIKIPRTNNWRKLHGKPMVRRVKVGGKYV